jgi:tetratricopeptide (TPR) repeat protein/serine/threonine protein kinase
MPVKVFCPNVDCNASYSIAPGDADRIGQCRACGTQFEMGPEASWSSETDGPLLLGETDRPKEFAGALGSQFGRYKILRRLGRGGMGSVYLAYDDLLDRPIALKIPHFELGSGPEVVGRFLREARAAARFHHPNFCPIHDIGEIEGTHFLAMAYIEGQTLGSLIERDRSMNPRRAAEIVDQLARALAEAHRRGIVHRDLKPSNVMIDARGTLILMDFGVARRSGTEDVEWTRSGALLGTPHYMSPEQVRGEKQATGPAIDIYALGVILYQIVAGRRPFEGPISLVLGLIALQEPERPSTYRPDLDPELEAICLKAMAKRPEDRYPSMEALASALDGYLARLAPARPPDSWPVKPAEPTPTPTPTPSPAVLASTAPTPGQPRGCSIAVTLAATAAILVGVIGLAGFALVRKGMIQLAAVRSPVEPKPAVEPKPSATAPPNPSLDRPTNIPSPVEPPRPEPTPTAVASTLTMPPPAPPVTAPRKLAAEAIARGSARLKAKDYVGAIAEFDEALRLDPENADALEDRANARIAREEYDEALADLDRALAIDPKHADAHESRGQIYLARKDYDRAILDFRSAIRLDQDHPRAFLNRGRAYQAKGEHDRAIADFTEALDNLDDEKDPDDARRASALFHRGTSHLDQNQLENAVADLEKAIELDPNLADAHVNLGRADFARKDYDKAIRQFQKALILEKDHAGAFMSLGLAYDAKGEHRLAIANFTEAIKNDGTRAETYLERAESRLALGEYDLAIEDCDQAIRRAPRLADAYDVRGIARHQRREYDLAIADFTAATQLDSKHPNAFEGLGFALLEKKEYARAVASLDQALRIDPDDGRANAVLAAILASSPDDALRDGRRALALATRACETLKWRDPYALNALAQAHAELGEFARAVARLSEAIDLIPDEATRKSYRSLLESFEQGRPYRYPR